MRDVIRVGIIGCGSVADKYIPHLHGLNYPRPRVEITMTCDLRPELRHKLRERFGIEAFTTDEREIIDAPEIDLVLVLTSMPEHGRLAKAALAAGKHVLVEKPMAMTLPEAAELVELARSSRGYLVCAPHVVLSKTYQSMWRRLHDGDIGKVYSARGFYGWAGPSWGRFFYQPGGGAMFDLGVYNVTTLTGLLGPARRVVAFSGIAIPERTVDGLPLRVETDDNAQLLLDFGDACFAAITTGFTIQQYNVPGIELYGAEGTLQMIGEDWAPRGYELWLNREGCWRIYHDRGWHWTDGIRHLVECIERGTPPVMTPEHAYHVLEIMLRSFDSARTGRTMAIESTFEPLRFDTAPVLGAGGHLVHDAGRTT